MKRLNLILIHIHTHNSKNMTYEEDDNMFSLSELYHENSKMRNIDREFYAWVNHVNTSPQIRKMISNPNYNYNGYDSINLNDYFSFRDEGDILCDIIKNRRSNRKFIDKSIDLYSLSKILNFANGVTLQTNESDGSTWKLRSTPSPGGLYPIEIYCIIKNIDNLEPGIYLYSPIINNLIQIEKNNKDVLFERLCKAMSPMKQTLKNSPVTFLLCANMPRINFKYKERAYRFALLEVGHIAQNILIGTGAENLGSICIGGYIDNELNTLINADGVNKIVHYAVSIGHIQKD
ncbi:SagB-type dehydrogenase domain-containing protein [Chryseobacterium indologenes]|nr:SagB-type dehydrogenase domain-containing protein [Chryseobacterium indologenes]SUX49570.1 SagB-type dehydrogenase domain [Chryseobacterium indologenes]